MRALHLSPCFAILAACGFGDDGRLQSGIDAAANVDAAVDAPIDARPMAQTFEARPATAIPDNEPTGISVPFNVNTVTFATSAEVQVGVAHTFRGDVRIELLRGTTVLKVLKMESTDANDNINETYQITGAELGAPLNAIYSVRFIDTDQGVIGTVAYVRLTFKVT